MFALSTTRRLCARWVLAWYVLFVGVSVLAATLQPKTMDVVCSAMGIMKVVVQGEGEAPPVDQQHGLPDVRSRHTRIAAAHGGGFGPCPRCTRVHRASLARGAAAGPHRAAAALSRAACF